MDIYLIAVNELEMYVEESITIDIKMREIVLI